MQMEHVQQKIQQIKQAYGQLPLQDNLQDPFGTLNDRVAEPQVNPLAQPNPMRRSNSKMKFEQAKELDAGLNKGASADDAGTSGGHLQIGNHEVDQLRRENDRRERQAEYQAFLSKQAQQK